MVGIIIVQNFSISALRAAAAAFKQEELRRQQHHNTSRKRRKETGEHGEKLKKLKVTYNLWTHFDAFLSAGYLLLFLFFSIDLFYDRNFLVRHLVMMDRTILKECNIHLM
mgnify:CR=1 FL=1